MNALFIFQIVLMIGLPNSLFGVILITPPKTDSSTSVVKFLSKNL